MTGKTFTLTEAGWKENRTVAFFQYSLETSEETFQFEEALEFPISIPNSYESEALLRALHIALGISYYKSFVPPIITHPYAITEVEADFWNTVYVHGLGEFLYKNNLKPEQLAKFFQQDGNKIEKGSIAELHPEAFLGLGGGKDSIVAGELLKECGITFDSFVLASGEQLGQTLQVADVMQTNLFSVKRYIDKKIIEVNNKLGAFNGHVPISVIFALVGAMLAVGKNKKYVVVANESSSSIPQATLGNLQINHQWSKSITFERLFQDYLHAYIHCDLYYFSVVRPLTSVAIAKIFSSLADYFDVFTSDNSLFKIDQAQREHPRWSKDSSKTLSSYILLSPWLDKNQLRDVFGYDYLHDLTMKKRVIDLLGSGNPVLDCVGTPEELKASLAVAARNEAFSNSELLKDSDIKRILTTGQPLQEFEKLDVDAIPTDIKQTLLAKIKEKL